AHALEVDIDDRPARLANEVMMLVTIRVVLLRSRTVERRDDARPGQLLDVAVDRRRRHRGQAPPDPAVQLVGGRGPAPSAEQAQQRLALGRHSKPWDRTSPARAPQTRGAGPLSRLLPFDGAHRFPLYMYKKNRQSRNPRRPGLFRGRPVHLGGLW